MSVRVSRRCVCTCVGLRNSVLSVFCGPAYGLGSADSDSSVALFRCVRMCMCVFVCVQSVFWSESKQSTEEISTRAAAHLPVL